ncbi:MAG TPA: hypothetical protein VF159_07120 [Gemmatimonadaceae bacterium]
MRRTLAGCLGTFVVLALLGPIGCAGAPRQRPVEMGPVETGPGTTASARKFLEGRWTLESFQFYPPGGTPIALKGSGVLVYDDYSNLHMEIRADQSSADTLRAAGIDIRDGVISTDGRTAIDLQNHTLTYVLQGQAPLVPGPLSVNRPRYWVVEENTLILTTKDDAGNPLSVGRWKRSQ